MTITILWTQKSGHFSKVVPKKLLSILKSWGSTDCCMQVVVVQRWSWKQVWLYYKYSFLFKIYIFVFLIYKNVNLRLENLLLHLLEEVVVESIRQLLALLRENRETPPRQKSPPIVILASRNSQGSFKTKKVFENGYIKYYIIDWEPIKMILSDFVT